VRPAALLALLAVAGCGSAEPAAPQQDAAAPCASLPAADPQASLPEGFPQLPDQVLYGAASQGSTTIVFGRVEGDDFRALRDRLAQELEASGYTLDGTDQEAVEAEAHFSQPREGSVRVKQLCEGVLEVRYRLSG
jgi:acylphosphatase